MGSRGPYASGPQAVIRRAWRSLGLLVALGVLLALSLWPTSSASQQQDVVATASMCTHPRRPPRIVSHRGVDEDQAGGVAPSTAARLQALLGVGITSFDVDLFWVADDDGGDELFVGHPPSLRTLWGLAADVHAIPLATLRQRSLPDGLLRLADMLRIFADHRNKFGQVSLELKFPTHPEWHRRLAPLYAQLAAARLATHAAVVVNDAAQAAAHRAAQTAAALRVPIFVVVRDNDAPIGPDGQPHANLSALADEPLYDGWSASWKVLDTALRRASLAPARGRTHRLAVWVCDHEPELRRVWDLGAEDVVSNRPLWARSLLERWQKEEEARCKTNSPTPIPYAP